MHLTSAVLSTITGLALSSNALLAQDYLTKDGHLTKPLKIVQLQGGFAGFTGVQYSIAPDGTWTSESVFREKTTLKNKGKLTEKERAMLGAILEKYELATLPEKSGKPPGANPHTLTIEFGKKKATLVGQGLPKLDPNNPTVTVGNRFAGIWDGILTLMKSAPSPKGKNKDGD